jgi:hypothetical protein
MAGRKRLAAVAAIALAACGAGAASAQAEVVWLCKPGMADNPCRDSLKTTVYDSNGASRVEDPPLPDDPPIDCFYVYPTVSEQPSRNANKAKDEQVRAIARYQAARFSQTCRVYAPVYRQQTLGALAAGGSKEALELAYGDVLEAWNEYLERDNGGRGVVLVGHSQGTRMLRQLIRGAIDGTPAVRERIVSAILLGGNVTVRRGQTAGGDFQNLPACTRPDQTGCVIAFSTFNETPPPNSRYGRPPAEDTSGFGFPAGPDYEILCTNPASLGANDRAPLSTYLRSEPFLGVIGVLLVQTYGGPPPSAPTPWLQPEDHYSGRCETHAGANVLMIEPIAGARKLNPAPDDSWGLHVADGNIALGDLVGAVERQAAAYTAPAIAPARARPGLTATFARGRAGCARAPVRLTATGTDIRSVDFKLGRRLIARDVRAPFRATVARKRLRPGAVHRLRAVVRLADGSRVVRSRRIRACV